MSDKAIRHRTNLGRLPDRALLESQAWYARDRQAAALYLRAAVRTRDAAQRRLLYGRAAELILPWTRHLRKAEPPGRSARTSCAGR